MSADTSYNIYIADTDDNLIRMVNNSSGIITTVAGGGTPCSPSPETESECVRQGGLATSAVLNAPNGVVVDASGNIDIADTGNGFISVVDPSGKYNVLAGQGTRDFWGDGGLAIDAALFEPQGLAVDVLGNIYVADTDNDRIRVIGVAPTVTVICSPNPITYSGLDSVCTVTVSGGATGGTVSLTYNNGNGWTSWTSFTLGTSSSGTATWSSTTGAGVFNIVAAYGGDPHHSQASGSTTLTVTQATPALSVSASPSAILAGQSLALTATLSGAVNPIGTDTVTFQITPPPYGSTTPTTLGTVLVSGTGPSYILSTNVSTSDWAQGYYTISAIYSGDTNNANASGTAPTPETVYVEPLGSPGAPGTAFSPGFGPPGTTLTITSTNPIFGTSPGTVTLNGISATICNTCWSTTSITVQLPQTIVAGAYPVVVNEVNGTSNVPITVGQTQSLFLVTPEITGLSFPSGPPTMGLTIYGSGFGTTQGDSTVSIGSPIDPVTAPVVVWGDASIIIQVPTGMYLGVVDISVNVAYGSLPYFSDSNPWPFTVENPYGCN